MYWLDNNTGISTAPTPPAVISLTKRFFTNGGLGEQPSIPEDFWFNMIQEELLGVLTMAGVAPVKNDLGQLAKAIQSIAFNAYPVGAPIPWPTAVPPSGFLALNGQTFSLSAYPKLALAYPSGVLPDLRGEFIRGWDSGRGVDPDRAIASSQSDRLRTHRHDLLVKSTPGGASTVSGGGGALAGSSSGLGRNTIDPAEHLLITSSTDGGVDGPIRPSGAAETAPRNLAFFYIVRAI